MPEKPKELIVEKRILSIIIKMALTNEKLSRKIDQLEKRVSDHDEILIQFGIVDKNSGREILIFIPGFPSILFSPEGLREAQ